MRWTSIFVVMVALCLAGCGPKRFPWGLKPGKSFGPGTGEVGTVDTGYQRTQSRVLVRTIARPTRANLDYAAYHANVMTLNPAPEGITPAASCIPDAGALFGGVLVPESIKASIGQTPLTSEERNSPMAFAPLVDVLSQWNYEKASPLEDARTSVRSESWGGQKSIQITYQEITSLYLHDAGDGSQWLVKIEFAPWTRLFSDMPDEDGDGFPEIYGQLKPSLIDPEVMAYIKNQYAGKVLDQAGVKAWANELASYWYPSYNTDIFDMAGASVWPVKETEAEIVSALKGKIFEHPTVVIRGKPRGKALYNLFLVDGMFSADKDSVKKPDAKKPDASQGDAGKRELTVLLGPQRKVLASELEKMGGGSWEKWNQEIAGLHKAIHKKLKSRPIEIKALAGKGGFLFFRNSLDYVVGGDLQQQAAGKNPYATIVDFKDYLAGLGVDFLLVPIPTKSEVFADKLLPGKWKTNSLPVLNPYGRKLLAELTEAGVEVVDLLPEFLAARAQRKKGDEWLYQTQDTHWTDRGLKLASGLMAERIKRYPWYEKLAAKPVAYKETRVTFKRHGDLVSRLAEKEKKPYKPQNLVGHRVSNPDKSDYEDDAASPIVVLGDSFTGVYQRTYCRNAGVSAHLALQLQYPVDLVMSYGGGPNVRQKLLRRGEADLAKKRLVIWMFAARDLYNYWEDWEPLEKKKK
ncbi:MAG: hypothetical protein JRF33_23980 [Deltaproteobacteria bacterium]|nr:hypothetical protein [Deltaproteobacteria bacterium]